MTEDYTETVAEIADRCDVLMAAIDEAQKRADEYRAAHVVGRQGIRTMWSSPVAQEVYRAQIAGIESLRAALIEASDKITPDDTDCG